MRCDSYTNTRITRRENKYNTGREGLTTAGLYLKFTLLVLLYNSGKNKIELDWSDSLSSFTIKHQDYHVNSHLFSCFTFNTPDQQMDKQNKRIIIIVSVIAIVQITISTTEFDDPKPTFFQQFNFYISNSFHSPVPKFYGEPTDPARTGPTSCSCWTIQAQ